jgi:hypothetical protein
MTKKEFKSMCDFHTYTGWNGCKIRNNAIYFDWVNGLGYKYMVYANVQDCTKAELFDYLYKKITNKIKDLPYYIIYKCAINDSQRFKVFLSLR